MNKIRSDYLTERLQNVFIYNMRLKANASVFQKINNTK